MIRKLIGRVENVRMIVRRIRVKRRSLEEKIGKIEDKN